MDQTARLDGPASDALLKLGRFFTDWDETDDGRAVFRKGGRAVLAGAAAGMVLIGADQRLHQRRIVRLGRRQLQIAPPACALPRHAFGNWALGHLGNSAA